MNFLKSVALAAVLILSLSCTRPQAPVTDAVVDGSADELFSQLVNQLESKGFRGEEVNSGDRTLTTSFKEFATKQLPEYAKLSEDLSRYDKGRYALKVQVSEEDGGKSKVHVEAIVEGYFRPMQATSSTYGTSDKGWKGETSTGKAEGEYLASLRN